MNIFDDKKVFDNYCQYLIGAFYKILPIKESGEPSLVEYMKSFQAELIGCNSLLERINWDSSIITLISILEFLINNNCDVATVKREVFKAINICKKINKKYSMTAL